jgi:mono/diheme cytochrome c family protein
MLSTISFVVAALSSGNKLGLALVGGAFIAWAILASFVLPHFWPDFPGKGMPWFIALSVVFFVAMVSAVLVFGKEKEEPAAAATQTTATATTTSATTTGAAPSIQGNPVAGKAVFASAGCAGCHTLKAAGSTGTIGPNLDQLKPPLSKVVPQVINGGPVMPAFKGQLSAKQIADVSAYVVKASGGNPNG